MKRPAPTLKRTVKGYRGPKRFKVGDLVTFKRSIYGVAVYKHMKGAAATVVDVHKHTVKIMLWDQSMPEYGPWWEPHHLKHVKVPK